MTTAPPPAQRRASRRWIQALLASLVVAALLATIDRGQQDSSTELTFSAFLVEVDAGRVQSAAIEPDGVTTGTLSGGASYETRVPVNLTGDEFLARLEAAGVTVEAVAASQAVGAQILSLLFLLLPVALLIGFFVWMGRRSGSMLSGAAGMGRSKAKVFDATRPETTFADVAGYEAVKAEIVEIADVLRDPSRYAAAGASTPRGVLMTGPPGTGKTLMARALAGEVGVPFLSVTGSSFVEMFVGVGAARVRDLFAEARKVAPAIIFVDEIDTIGQRRHSGAIISNDEREQTLNQLLAEMDGFDPHEGIIVLAATNRPEVLDPALLRAGRFDRQVMIPLPNQEERLAILGVHCKGKHLGEDADLDALSRTTPGFSGADLANLVNEAAIRAARADRSIITGDDLEAAHDRVLLGLADGSNVLLPEERVAVATHEAGHALVAALSPNADPVHKVTILPAGLALGATHQIPLHERHLFSERYLFETLAVQLGGRAAEIVVFGQASTGAANDLATVTMLASRMVKEYGMSQRIGPVGYQSGGSMFLGPDQEVQSRPFSDETQRAIDEEVTRLANEAQDRAIQVVRDHRSALDQLVDLLLESESIEGSVVYGILGIPVPGARPQVLRLDDDTVVEGIVGGRVAARVTDVGF